jgi:hypothetical protein
MSKHDGTYTQQEIKDQIINAMESVAGMKAILAKRSSTNELGKPVRFWLRVSRKKLKYKSKKLKKKWK